ncbi:DUF2855 family protein [Streptomyces sp. WAC06614]|nr:DUF2855 family protein [Streptomyces sp. WAC06614]
MVIDRDDLARTELIGVSVPEVAEGEVLLRVDRVGLTANNVTYAVLGTSVRYWDFFPTREGWGVVPVWGFAEVVASRAAGVEPGSRVYGYLPSGSHLLVRAGGVDARGFRDDSPHRADLPSVYNHYTFTATDPLHDPDRADLRILYQPLFWTSFMLADQVVDQEGWGADQVVLSSASSKTAYGTAFLLKGRGREVVGLTSRGNVAFTEGLGCYDRVSAYEDLAGLPSSRPTLFLDFAGDSGVTERLRGHLGSALVHGLRIGVTHQQGGFFAAGSGADATFFAPEQIRKRAKDWGPQELNRRLAAGWQEFTSAVVKWVEVVHGEGARALEETWREVQAGRTSPRTGHVLAL